jgi:hypothetical protein
MDGTAIPSHKGRWVITDVTGQHQFAMSADGYKPETWTAILQRGQTSAKAVVLQPIIETPKQATLAIRNGTPGAEVFLKGQRVGELDSNGNLELHDALSKGTYKLTMRKAYYEDREIEVVATGDSREVTPQGNMALTPWPTLSFQTHIPGARVTFWRVDTPGPKHEVGATQKNPLPAGTYAISATAAGYEDFATTVTLNKDVEVPLAFTAIHDYELQDPNQVTREGEWLKAKKKDVALRPGVLHVFLTFTRPGKQQFGNKKVEWFVVSPDRQQRVHYTLEGSKLHRELQVGGGVSGASDLTADVRAGGEQAVVGVVVTVEGDRIRIYNEQRKTLDDFTAPTAEFGDGSIVVRTDTLFRIRRDEQ